MRIGSTFSIQNQLSKSSKDLSKTFQQLSTGKRINSGGDDPAGLALAQALKSNVDALDIANRNISSAQNALETASGGVGQSLEQLQNLRDLAVQASNGTLSDSDRSNLQNQFQQGLQNLDDISSNTNFNGQNLLDGSFNASVQTGSQAGQNTTVAVGNMSSSALGLSGQNVSSQSAAQDAIQKIDDAISKASAEQSKIGAGQNALEFRSNANSIARENLEAARSQTEDADYAEVTSNLSKQRVIQQTQVEVLREQLKQQAQVANQFFGPKK